MATILPYAQSASAVQPPLSHSDYSVGWISALPLELTAAQAMLDHVNPPLPQSSQDDNVYTLGTIGKHNVVLACLPSGQMGTNPATAVATQMRSTFPAIRFGLMVGIGGGCPSAEHDIRLEDVVVSKPGKHDGGVIQFDFGRTVEEGRFIRNGVLNAPPTVLLNAISAIQAAHDLSGNRIEQHLSSLNSTSQRNDYAYPGLEHDLLFQSDYDHGGYQSSCQYCDRSRLVIREKRSKAESPMIHYGTIASGNQVMRHGATRERLRRETGALCFEMEAAGLMNTFSCLVIRGICDYADSHKSKMWQGYAGATAAAYAKEILSVVPKTSLSAPPGRQLHDPQEDTLGECEHYLNHCILNYMRFKPMLLKVAKSTCSPPLSYLPFQRNQFFSGRKSTLESIETHFANSAIQQAYILQGMGGLGKTQIALEYAYQALDKGFHAFWVNCTTPETLHSDFRRLRETMTSVKEKDNEQDRIPVLRWLESHENWVLVFDNADDSKFPYQDWIPNNKGNSPTRRILFTTRDERLIDTFINFKENVPLMSQTESVDLFNATASRALGALDRNQENVNTLVKRLGNLPLAIALASAYVRQHPMVTIEQYLELLQNFSDRSKLFAFKRSFSNYNHSIMTAFEVSFVKVQADNPRATEILTVLGFVKNNGFTFEQLKRVSQNMVVDKLSFLKDSTSLQQSLGLLRSLALVSFGTDDDTTLSLHPLVHECIQARLTDTELRNWGLTTLRVIYNAWVADTYPQGEVISTGRDWISHTKFALRAVQRQTFPKVKVHEECYFLLLCVLIMNDRITLRTTEDADVFLASETLLESESEEGSSCGSIELLPERNNFPSGWDEFIRRNSDSLRGSDGWRPLREEEPPRKSLHGRMKWFGRDTNAGPESKVKSLISKFNRIWASLLTSGAHSSRGKPTLDDICPTKPVVSLAKAFANAVHPKCSTATSVCTQMALKLIEMRNWWMLHERSVPVDIVDAGAGRDAHLTMLNSFLSLCDLIPVDDNDKAVRQFPPHAMGLLFIYIICASMNVGRRIEMTMEKHIAPLKAVLLQKAHQVCRRLKPQGREPLLLQTAISYARFIDERSLGQSYWLPVQSCLIRSMKYVLRESQETALFFDFMCQSMWELDHEMALWRFSRFIEPIESRISWKWMGRLDARWNDLRIDEHSYHVGSESEKELMSTLSAIGIH